MGLGDVRQSVIPKFGLVAPAQSGGTLTVRYFMPWKCHPTMAVTGAQCVAACILTPGSVAHGMSKINDANPVTVVLEHPTGSIDVLVDYHSNAEGFKLVSAGLVRTARKLAEGTVFVPQNIWAGQLA